MLEVRGEEELGEVGGVENEEAVVPLPPPDQGVGLGVVHHVVDLGHEGRHLDLMLYITAVLPFHPPPQWELQL